MRWYKRYDQLQFLECFGTRSSYWRGTFSLLWEYKEKTIAGLLPMVFHQFTPVNSCGIFKLWLKLPEHRKKPISLLTVSHHYLCWTLGPLLYVDTKLFLFWQRESGTFKILNVSTHSKEPFCFQKIQQALDCNPENFEGQIDKTNTRSSQIQLEFVKFIS